MGFAVVAHQASETNLALASRGWAGARGELLAPRDALRRLRPGDVALNRLDVLPTLDGVEEGLWIVSQLEAHGVRVLNPPSALLSAHDKLLTARLLESAGVPHPRTGRLIRADSAAGYRFPVVAKPRFGSWGREVHLCQDVAELGLYLGDIASRQSRRAGAVVQELVPPMGRDLRVVVAGGSVVGAASREAAPGEWRTNVALGGVSTRVIPEGTACALALRATAVLGLDLAGIDLLPVADGYVVLEVNGAVDFRPHYSGTRDVYAAVLDALARGPALLTA